MSLSKNKKLNTILRSLLVLVLVILASLSFLPQSKAAFTDPITISTSGAGAYHPAIDVDGNGIIHTVWVEESSGNREIIYSRSTDDGLNFPSKINISSSAYLSTSPEIEVDSANVVYVVWEEDTASGNSDIYFATSTDSGLTFSAPKNISNTATQSVSPAIETSSGNRIQIVWTDETVGEITQLFYANSSDGGNTFSSPANISNTSDNLDNPIVRAVGSVVGAIWEAQGPQYGIYRVRSTDNGATFGTALNISSDNTTPVYNPAIGIDGTNRVHIAASAAIGSPTQFDIFYSRSTDGGATFTSPVNLSGSSLDSRYPVVIAVGANNVVIAWSETFCNATCEKRIRVRRSTDGGATFGASTTPTTLITSSEDSDFDIYGLNLYLVYQENNIVRFIKGSQDLLIVNYAVSL